jgi:uncharacterized protein (TIGR02421 family)
MKSELAKISNIITELSLLTPINLEEEKKKFFLDTTYNPQFVYPPLKFPAAALRKDLERYLLKPQHADERISMLMQERVRELLCWIDLQEARGTKDFTQASLALYGRPSARVLAQAENLLEATPFEVQEEKPLKAKDVVKFFEQALIKEGVELEIVLKEDMLSRMSIAKGKELRINATANFSMLDVQKLLAHEVKTHVRRLGNARKQELDILETGTAHFLETEEGLATFNEDAAGLLSGFAKRSLGARVIAVDKAMEISFAEVFAFLLPFVGEEKAFEHTLNMKKGLCDTSKPGGFTKSYIYFSGWLKVKSLPASDMPYLYVGKVSCMHVPLMKELVKEGKVKLCGC